MRVLLLFMGAIVLSSAAAAQTDPELDERLLKAAFELTLKDADSARFRALRYKLDAPGGWTMCGEVNSKNSYGGYAGFQPFYALVLKIEPGPVEYSVVGMGKSAGDICREIGLRT